HRRVDDRELAESGDDGLYDEGEVGEFRAALGVAVFVLAAKFFDVGEIEFEDGGDVRRGVLRFDHVLRDALAHDGKRFDARAFAGRVLRLGLTGWGCWRGRD